MQSRRPKALHLSKRVLHPTIAVFVYVLHLQLKKTQVRRLPVISKNSLRLCFSHSLANLSFITNILCILQHDLSIQLPLLPQYLLTVKWLATGLPQMYSHNILIPRSKGVLVPTGNRNITLLEIAKLRKRIHYLLYYYL